MKAIESTITCDYFTARGLRATAPENLNVALRMVLDAMPTVLYGEPRAGASRWKSAKL